MKKLLIISALMLSMSISAKTSKLIDCEGKWVSAIPMTKMSTEFVDVTYTFTKDSLYIDVYPSGCPLVQMSISNVSEIDKGFKCDAIDTLYDLYNGDKVHERLYHLEFIKMDKKYLEVKRDGETVDVIKRFP